MKKKKGKKAELEGAASPSIDKDWRARSDLDLLTRAHEVLDDSPRFNAAKREAEKQKKHLERIARLKDQRI